MSSTLHPGANSSNGEGSDACMDNASTSRYPSRLPQADADPFDLVQFHVEVRLKPAYDVPLEELRRRVQSRLINSPLYDVGKDSIYLGWQDDPHLVNYVEQVRICEAVAIPKSTTTSAPGQENGTLHSLEQFVIHAYYAAREEDLEELMTGDADGEEQGPDDSMAATVLELPNAALEGVWESLIYDDDIQFRLLNYMQTTLLYSDAKIDFSIISWNRLVLLHGPPGTGKTSLCRALAQKLSIRLSHRYSYGKLIEINSHSLFSKWFSESGKLVQRLFSMVTEMVADEDALVVVLIDEVESLTASRSAAASGTEPGDAVRVVNALLTQLDKLKTRKNCLVVTTSNLSDTIDNAFLDRADLKQYIGPPPARAVYAILQSCLAELLRVGLVVNDEATDEPALLVATAPWDPARLAGSGSSSDLHRLANNAIQLSGRTLRKLPVLAHARHISQMIAPGTPAPVSVWLEAMGLAVEESKSEINKTAFNASPLSLASARHIDL